MNSEPEEEDMPLDQDPSVSAGVSEEFAPPPVDDDAAMLVRATLLVVKH